MKDILNDYFNGEQISLTKQIVKSIETRHERHDNKINLNNIHSAMNELENVFATPLPTVEESVTMVISKNQLETMITYLNECKVHGFMFTIAPILRTLTSGKYSNSVPNFFNLPCEYNLEQLKLYIEGNENVEGLRGLYEQYKATKEELDKLYK